MNSTPTDIHADAEKHADAIIRVCSYHRRDFDLVVVRSRPHHMQLVQTSLQAAFEESPTAKLGMFDNLPVELIHLVLHNLDIRSLFHFRQINRRARVLSTGLYEYQLVSKHGLEGLRGLLRAGLAHRFTIFDLYRPLVTDKCSTCGGFGGLLFLFTAERCCFNCLRSSARYCVLLPSAFAELTHMSPSRLQRLSGPTLLTVRGTYNMMDTIAARRPNYLILERKATKLLLAAKAINQDATRNLSRNLRRGEQLDHRFMAATAYPCYGLEDGKLERGVSCKGCQVRLELLRDELHWFARDETFSTQGFLSHFAACVEAQHIWAESEEGTRPVNEPEFTRRSGLFTRLGPGGLLR